MQLRATPLFSSASIPQTLEQIEREFGTGAVPQIFRLLEAQPLLLTHFWGQFQTLIVQGDLPRVLKEMVGLVVATATHCNYIQVVQLYSLKRQSVKQKTLTAIVQGDYEAAEISHATCAVLTFTAVAIANRTATGLLTKHEWQTLHTQTTQALDNTGLEASEQLELITAIALFEQLCTIASLLWLDPEKL